MATAVQNPTWVIYLGRKSCPPSRPIFAGTADFPDLKNALSHRQWPDGAERRTAVLECAPTADDAVRRRDHLASRRYRVFHPRYTRTVALYPPQEEAPS
jgi:CRISPR system Cascade subunit CasD